MKFDRKSATAATLLAGAVVLGLFLHQTASSNALAEPAGKCSAQTLKGSYGIKFEGIKFADENFPSDRAFCFGFANHLRRPIDLHHIRNRAVRRSAGEQNLHWALSG